MSNVHNAPKDTSAKQPKMPLHRKAQGQVRRLTLTKRDRYRRGR
jgi:hypothetical protein